MNSKNILLGAVLMASSSLALGQHAGHPVPPPSAPAAPGNPTSAQEMSPASAGVIDRLSERLELARQSNDPIHMRAALDDVQNSLGDLKRYAAETSETTESTSMGGMPSMDHSKMSGMPGMDQSKTPGMQGMDHSKMPGTKGMDQSRKSGKQSMDHSKMEGMPGMSPSGTAANRSKKSMPGMAPPPKSPPSGKTKEMDHSQMDMSGKDNSMKGMPGMNAPAKKAQPASAAPAGKEISQGSPQAKTKEPICFKDGDTQGAEKATYKGKTYYFCSRADREKFLSDPAPYVNR